MLTSNTSSVKRSKKCLTSSRYVVRIKVHERRGWDFHLHCNSGDKQIAKAEFRCGTIGITVE